MPFTPVQTLRTDPLVRVFFSGQLVLTPAAVMPSGERACEVFVNRCAPDHHLSIEVRQKRAGRRDIILMRHLGPLAFAEVFTPDPDVIHGMLIGVLPSEGDPRGVFAYDGAQPSTEGLRLGHAINLEELHQDASPPVSVAVDTEGARPSILLNDATLYTAERTARLFDLSKAGGPARELSGFASLVGANIYQDGLTLTMSWRQNGRPVFLPFTPPPAGDPFTYEVYVTNDPLFDPDSLEGAGSSHDELKEFYKILPGVPTHERFTLTMRPEASSPPASPLDDERGSTRTPCMPVIGGG